ncbi:MAG: hypothetical protein ABSG01_08945 [Anaerolineales bacterium]|jgi:hypothetical protein
MDRLYCTVADLAKIGGNEADLVSYIRAASSFIDQELGAFIPFAETKRFDGNGEIRLRLTTPLLEVTGSILNYTTTLTTFDWLTYPRDRMWENGPYTSLAFNPLAPHGQVWINLRDAVAVPGLWGKLEKSVLLGVVLAAQQADASGTTLQVADGSQLSPGMVLLVEAEQELVTATGAPTAGVTTLGTALNNADEALTPASVAAAAIGETIRIDFEKLLVLDKNATQWSVVRGYRNTTKAAHSNGAAIDAYRTFVVTRGVNGTTAITHALSTPISRYLPPESVSTLCKAIATLLKKLDDAQYAGKTGNANLGEVFYNNAFPRDIWEKVESQFDVA